MDLSESIIPKSDQLNSDDLIAAPVTVTITDVRAGNSEQPIEVHLAEFPGRPYKPSKSMRRVLVQAWGAEGSAYTGRRLTLFRNPEITFGREKVGGIEISHMSHLPKRLTVSLMVTRGKRKPFTVEPLTEAPEPKADKATGEIVERDWAAEIQSADTDQLRALWNEAPAEYQDTITTRAKEMNT